MQNPLSFVGAFACGARTAALAAVLAAAPLLAHATHDPAPISDFDHVGMGTFTGNYTQSVSDHPWFIFNANAGNTVTIQVSTPAWVNGGSFVWLYRAPDGCAEIGDASANGTLTLVSRQGPGTSYTVTYAVPAAGQYAVQLDSWLAGAGAYTVTLAGSTAATALCSTLIPVLATAPLATAAFCPGDGVSVPFTTTLPFAAGNVFTAQLSDASGSFAAPTAIGTLAGTGSGAIAATIPATTPAGAGYRIRVTGADPAVTGTDNGSDLTVNALPTPLASTTSATLYLGYGPQTATLSASGGNTYAWAANRSPSYLSSTSGASVVFAPAAAGAYVFTVTATTAAGCSATANVAVEVIDVRCGNKNNKVLVCHQGQALCVDGSAIAAHLAHGDQLGGCSANGGRNAMAGDGANELAVYPNPAADRATVAFRPGRDGAALVQVYNHLGQRVATLLDGAVSSGQLYNLALDGRSLAPGLYMCRLVLNGQAETRQLNIVK